MTTCQWWNQKINQGTIPRLVLAYTVVAMCGWHGHILCTCVVHNCPCRQSLCLVKRFAKDWSPKLLDNVLTRFSYVFSVAEPDTHLRHCGITCSVILISTHVLNFMHAASQFSHIITVHLFSVSHTFSISHYGCPRKNSDIQSHGITVFNHRTISQNFH